MSEAKVSLVTWRIPIYQRGKNDEPTVWGDERRAISSQCANCKRLRFNLGCGAFRGPIPDAILNGEHDHTQPFEGDRGLRYLPLEEGEFPRLGWSDEDRDD